MGRKRRKFGELPKWAKKPLSLKDVEIVKATLENTERISGEWKRVEKPRVLVTPTGKKITLDKRKKRRK